VTKNVRRPPARGGPNIPPPATNSQGSTNLEYPVFCLRYLGNLPACEQGEKAAFIETLRTLAQMTWQQIMQARKQGLGHEKIPLKQIKASLPAFAKEEEFLLSFRFCGKAPMLGLREGATLRILHLDRDFTAYDHG
jgi:hypothetical protein